MSDDYSKYVYGVRDPEMRLEEGRMVKQLLNGRDGKFERRTTQIDPAAAGEKLFNGIKSFFKQFER